MVLVALATPACADPVVRVSDLAAHCRTADAYCLGYLDGYIDSASLFEMTAILQKASLPNDLPMYCLPQDFSVRAAAQKFVDVVAHNPAVGNDAAGTGVLEFLTTNYPCGPKQ
jgi:hypothetical protein